VEVRDSLDLMARRLFLLLLAVTAGLSLTGTTVRAVGINWGTEASHPLPPSKVVELLKSNGIVKVKLFDADPKVLRALSGSNIGVTIGIQNSMLKSLNASVKVAESWVHDNVTRYFNGGNRVRIEYLLSPSLLLIQLYIYRFKIFKLEFNLWNVNESDLFQCQIANLLIVKLSLKKRIDFQVCSSWRRAISPELWQSV